jgi:predicted transcriptional regulator of viral defense system
MRKSLLFFIKQLKRPVFRTQELASISGRSMSTAIQGLNVLEKQGLVLKVYRGIWIEANSGVSLYSITPYLLPKQKVYVSFISALHLYGIIEQIPQVVTLASTGHTKIIKTRLGVVSLHHITADFFSGFNWYKDRGGFLIAEPEKALVDSLYLSSCKKKQFGHFPELYLPKTFSIKRLKKWVERIPSLHNRSYVEQKLAAIF